MLNNFLIGANNAKEQLQVFGNFRCPSDGIALLKSMRCLVLSFFFLLPEPSQAQSSYELTNSLRDRAQWKSFGVKDWVSGDPVERAFVGRKKIHFGELKDIRGLTPVARLKSLIAVAEAGPRGYDAVHVQAILLPKKPTQMTLREIAQWVNATPGKPHAIGRYQIIPATMRELIRRSGFSPQTRFSPIVQDAFADILLADAGLKNFMKGKISQKRFMNNLARIWAGLPTSGGKSYYDGYAGNRHTISLTFFRNQMKEFFPHLS